MTSWTDHFDLTTRFRVRRLAIGEQTQLSDPVSVGYVKRIAPLSYEIHYRGKSVLIKQRSYKVMKPDYVRETIEKVVSTVIELKKKPSQTEEGQLCLL